MILYLKNVYLFNKKNMNNLEFQILEFNPKIS